jgi:hypothetical protein
MARITYHQFHVGEPIYEVKRNGKSVGIVSAHDGRSTKSRWRAKRGTATAFAPTRHEAVTLLWGES